MDIKVLASFFSKPTAMNKLKTYNILFYSLIAVAVLFIFLSNPFLVKEYDPWNWHLRFITEFYNGVSKSEGRIWHLVWARIFKFMGIGDIFIWAKIIHVFQFILAAIFLYFFSKTALTILIKSNCSKLHGIKSYEGLHSNENDINGINKLRKIQIKYLSLFAVFLWFIGNGTFSATFSGTLPIAYQQAWIMWYSVTYQGLTIPLFWYCTALTLITFYEELSFRKNLLCVIQIAMASFMIAKFHPQEFLYYIIHTSIIIIVNIGRIVSIKNKKAFLITIPIIFIIMFIAIKYFLDHTLPPFLYVISSQIVKVLQQINVLGHNVIDNLNRFPNSFSEIAIISIISMIIFRVNYLFINDKKISFNRNFFDLLLVSSLLFFLIPMVPFLAGLAAYITHPNFVYRFFFASPWFIFFPFALYKVITMREINIPVYKIVITVALILCSIAYFHKYLIPYHTFLNAKSIIYSLVN
jgi:hypothetical protein